jgi:hypothetical protein
LEIAMMMGRSSGLIRPLAVVGLGLLVACVIITTHSAVRTELSSEFEPWRSSPWQDQPSGDGDWYEQAQPSSLGVVGGNPAVVGGRVYLAREMAAPMQQLSEEPWTLDATSDRTSREEKLAYQRQQLQRYQRGEASSFMAAPMQQLSEEPWDVDGTSYKQQVAERVKYMEEQHGRYQRGEIREPMAQRPRMQALADMWEEDQTDDRLQRAEKLQVMREERERDFRHVRPRPAPARVPAPCAEHAPDPPRERRAGLALRSAANRRARAGDGS